MLLLQVSQGFIWHKVGGYLSGHFICTSATFQIISISPVVTEVRMVCSPQPSDWEIPNEHLLVGTTSVNLVDGLFAVPVKPGPDSRLTIPQVDRTL